jgi:hypothetical protein
MLEEVLDLDGHVICEIWVFLVNGLDEWERMPDAIEEVGIAEGDVFRAGRNLSPDILQHHVSLHDAEGPLIDRDNGTVAAQMPTAPTGLRVAYRSALPISDIQARIPGERRQLPPVRNQELLLGQ